MASGQRSALSATILVGSLLLGTPGAHSVTHDRSATCIRTPELVVVDLDNVKHRHILRHVFDARRNGQPRVLHIFREEGPANRRESLRGIPTRPGFDRDEYPPAMTDEGGKGASARYIGSGENRSAGGVMKGQLRPYCNEQRSSSNAGAIADLAPAGQRLRQHLLCHEAVREIFLGAFVAGEGGGDPCSS